jgi:uncharacterized glyoxalase superfamily protein PhnB
MDSWSEFGSAGFAVEVDLLDREVGEGAPGGLVPPGPPLQVLDRGGSEATEPAVSEILLRRGRIDRRGAAQAERIAFGCVGAPNGFQVMAYDVQPSKGFDPGEDPFYITLQGTDRDEIKPLWDRLAESATTILIPLALAAFAALYGMLTDRYGVTWIVGADTAPQSN